jgi:hypothetical protein
LLKTNEALKGGQKKLDVDGDGDIESDDLADLRAKKEKKVDEAGKTMSRAAKGHEKYGKEGMAALAKAGKEGKSLEPVKAKYNKYDESTAWKNKAQAMKESLESMLPTIQESEMDPEIMKIVQAAQQKDPEGFKDAAGKGPEALADYLNSFAPEQSASATDPSNPTPQSYEPSSTSPESNPGEEFDVAYKESLAESTDFDRMKQFLTRLNG